MTYVGMVVINRNIMKSITYYIYPRNCVNDSEAYLDCNLYSYDVYLLIMQV